ncbi:M56 family metallopeptidase [Sediminitomix flava]|uniref:Outer membrane transport energization protein TonB n=1 Tax=Sediminitomix flava TaxID=379075 RepID=A0A315Z7D0_SEDFL|nr:M56 family metallopeptidase [Sediminitomix flava]PWJ40142.1 outer membrane transport energization protein TonB [Sediminitomix flava]
MLLFLIKSSLYWGISYLLYLTYFSKKSSFKFNRYFLLANLILGLLIPFLELDSNYWSGLFSNEVIKQVETTLLLPSVTIGENLENGFQIWTLALYLYGTIATLLISRFLFGIFKLKSISSIPKKTFSHSNTKVVLVKSEYATFSFWDTVYWNNQYKIDSEEGTCIFEHELAHIQQKHFIDNLISELFCIAFWFNPMVWVFRKAISQNHEFLADHDVLKKQEEITPYANLLVSHIFLPLDVPIGQYFHKSLTLNRIKMMKNNQNSSWAIKTMSILFLTSLSLFFACENFQTEEENELQKNIDNTVVKSEAEFQLDPVKDKELEDVIFDIVEQPASFKGGLKGLLSWLTQEIQYPEQAKNMGVQGKVYVEFIVDREGDVTNATIKKGIGAGCDQEALRVIQNSPKWYPAKQRGYTVNQRLVLPINFKLDD